MRTKLLLWFHTEVGFCMFNPPPFWRLFFSPLFSLIRFLNPVNFFNRVAFCPLLAGLSLSLIIFVGNFLNRPVSQFTGCTVITRLQCLYSRVFVVLKSTNNRGFRSKLYMEVLRNTGIHCLLTRSTSWTIGIGWYAYCIVFVVLMLESRELHLVEAIDSSFSQMDEVYASIREHSADLASLRRQESRVGRHYASSEMPMSNNGRPGSYVDAKVLARVTLSFSTSAAQGLEKILDLLNLLRTLALKLFASCESLISALKEIIAKRSRCLLVLNNIVESVMEMVESMVDEIDILSHWVDSNTLPGSVATPVSLSLDFASLCLPDKMLSSILWREEVYPLLKFADMFKCF